MNFIPAKLSGARAKWHVQLPSGLDVPVPRDLVSPSKKGDVLLGLRPQHISRASSTAMRAGHARIKVKVELVQPTGSRAYITFPIGSVPVVAELDPHDVHGPGEMIDVDLDMNRAVIIDPETHRVI
jgi:multiple sugar transport system ATP-binding protein